MTTADMLKREEGLRLMPYDDSEGLLTIGYGRCLARKGISRAEAEMLFANDVADATALVHASFPWAASLTEPREAVLIGMVFQMGLTGTRDFAKMLAALQREDYATAADEMLDSKWARQTPERAQRMARQMRSGDWAS